MTDLVHRLWKNNWLNFRHATENVAIRQINKLYIAFELAETVIDANGVAYPNAINVLNYIYHSTISHTLVTTFLDQPYIDNIVAYTGLKYDWVNHNHHFSGSKPYYDILIDSRAGFQPSEWVYVIDMYKMAEMSLSPSKSHPSVFNKEKHD